MTLIEKIKYQISLFLIKIYDFKDLNYFLILSLNLKVFKIGAGKKKIFVFTKSEFRYDIEYLSRRNPSYKFYCLEIGHLKRIQKIFFNNKEYNPYEYLENFTSSKIVKFNNFLNDLIVKIKESYKISLIISCNFIYSPLRNIGNLCRLNNIKYLVVYKEGLVLNFSDDMKKSFDEYAKKNLYGNIVYNCDLVCCINKHIKNEIILNKKFNISSTKGVLVTGLPRFEKAKYDTFFDRNLNSISKKYRIMTLFDLDVIQSSFRFDERVLRNDLQFIKDLKNKIFETYDEVLNFIEKNEDYFLIFKLKETNSNKSEFTDFFNKKLIEKKIKKRTIIIQKYESQQFINYSEGVVSMPSTICFETISMGKKLLIPDFKNYFDHDKWHFFFNYKSDVFFFNNYEDINDIISNKKLFNKNDTLLSEMLSLDKTKSTTKISMAIDSLI